jgi:hypothetical protein
VSTLACIFTAVLYVSLCIAYSHVDGTGKVIRGTLIHIKCTVKIVILSPVDPTDHRMVVIVTGTHTHAIPRPHKPSIEGETTYRDLAKKFKESSIASLTVRRLANGQSFFCSALLLFADHRRLIDPATRQAVGSDIASVDPALANARHCRKILTKVKKENAPYGNDIMGESNFLVSNHV